MTATAVFCNPKGVEWRTTVDQTSLRYSVIYGNFQVVIVTGSLHQGVRSRILPRVRSKHGICVGVNTTATGESDNAVNNFANR